MKNKIGLFGGTFNPVHLGHLSMATQIKDGFSLDKVIFILAGKHPFKGELLKPYHRFEMLKLCLPREGFEVSDYEILKKGTSYTIDTILHFKALYPLDELFFLCGSDIVFEIESWKNVSEIFKNIRIIVALRNEDERLTSKVYELKSKYNADILIAYISIVKVSSTEIRENIQKGKSIKSLVTPEVEKYIKDNKLFLKG